MTDELRRALGEAYDAFAGYEYTHDLILPPGKSYYLRGLSVADWYRLDADNDMAVRLHEKEVLLHFLPRWLEWLSEEETRIERNYWDAWNLSDLERRLNGAQWQAWPTLEVAALREIFLAWTREDVAKYGGEPCFQFLVEIGEDLAPHLDLWLDANLLALTIWLWKIDWHNHQSGLRWAVSSRLKDALEAAFFADPDGPDTELFSRSVELVRSLRAL